MREILFAEGRDNSILFGSVAAMLSATPLLSLATVRQADGSPWANTAYFAWNDAMNLYFLSSPAAEHSKNLEKDPRCAATIFDSQQTGAGGKAGLQLFGECRRAAGNDLAAGLMAYQARFAGFDKVIGEPADFDKGIIEAKLYVLSASQIKVFDEATYGEEVWVHCEVRRGSTP